MCDVTENCQHCGHKELTVKYTYVLARTYENWISCECGTAADGVAAQDFYQVPELWEKLGYLEDGRAKFIGSTLVEKLPVEQLDILIHCQSCHSEVTKDDWETEEVDEAEIIEGPDAWMMFCNRCKNEVQFGWTMPNREGLMVPTSKRKYSRRELWIDPGFNHRRLIRKRK